MHSKMIRVLPFLAITLAASMAAAADETISKPAANSPEATVAEALKAGLAGDFDAYLAAIHPEHKETSDQRKQRENYEWKRFVKQVKWYVTSEKPIAFVVTRRVPEDKYYKIFVKDHKNKDRMPVPVTLKKDGSGWKIVTNSL